MDIIEALEWRYAVKKFDPSKKIEKTKLDRILKGVCLTATSMGMQLMDFFVIENQGVKDELLGACYNQNQVSTCSHLLVLTRKNNVTEEFVNDYLKNVSSTRKIQKESKQLINFGNMVAGSMKMEKQRQITWMDNQVYIALGNLLTICAAEKIDACPMEGFNPEKVDEILNLEQKGLKSVLLFPIGFRADDDKYATMPKVRRPIEETVHYI